MDGFKRVDGKTIVFWPEKASGGWLLTGQDIGQLIDLKQNARICLHESPEALFHDMLIIEWKELYSFPRHRHPTTNEAIQILRGSMDLKLGDKLITLWNHDGANISAGTWHETLPRTAYVVYRELKRGPFTDKSNEFQTEGNQA